jgi:hypothetical protein
MYDRILICRFGGAIHHELLALGWQEVAFCGGFVKLGSPS